MKKFSDFLAESQKQYEFRIKVAGMLDNEQLDKIEMGLEKWGLQTLGKPKVTPIQKHPVDFSNLKEIEVSIMDLVIDYPATPQEVAQRIHDYSHVPMDYIRVYNSKDPNEADREEQVLSSDKEEEYQVQLTSPYEKSKSDADNVYGEKFLKKFLKDQKRKPDFKVAGGKTSAAQTTNDIKQGTNSPISGRKSSK